jgi:hypothetical protein
MSDSISVLAIPDAATAGGAVPAAEVGGFEVTQLALNLAVTATGKVSLLGIGGELGGTAGLTVTIESPRWAAAASPRSS